MIIDITHCAKINIADSCAVSNLISSALLFARVSGEKFFFSITKYVEYECLYKPSRKPSSEHDELCARLVRHQKNNQFTSHHLSIDVLQDELLIEHSQQLGIGELSSIAFSKKINQSFLTDYQKARKIAQAILGNDNVQTTSHIVGWLFYNGTLADSDLEPIISEHKSLKRPLEKYFRLVYEEAIKRRLS